MVLGGSKRRHTEWQCSLSAVYSIMMEKSAQPGELNLPSRTKLRCTLQLRGQVHSPHFYSTPVCTLWGRQGVEKRGWMGGGEGWGKRGTERNWKGGEWGMEEGQRAVKDKKRYVE